MVSALILKLLAKTAEEIYQTAPASSATSSGAALLSLGGPAVKDRRLPLGSAGHVGPAFDS